MAHFGLMNNQPNPTKKEKHAKTFQALNDAGVTLTDLKRKDSEIGLYTVPGKPTLEMFTLRAFDLSDEEWLEVEFGDNLEKIFTEINFREISKILYNQLTDEGQDKLGSIEVTKRDGEGVRVKQTIGGYKRLRKAVRGYDHQMLLLDKLLETIGFSRPAFEKLTKAEQAEIKKKEKIVGVRTKRTGGKSTT